MVFMLDTFDTSPIAQLQPTSFNTMELTFDMRYQQNTNKHVEMPTEKQKQQPKEAKNTHGK